MSSTTPLSSSTGPSSLNPFYSHLLVLRKIPASLRTSSSLEEWIKTEAGYASEGASVLRWHDDDTAIVSFCEPLAATAALPLLSGAGRLGERFREAHEASHPFGALPKLTASVAASGVISGTATTPTSSSSSNNNSNTVAARLRQEALMPSPFAPVAARPLSDTSVASRLIRGALGPQRHVLGGRAAPSDPASTGTGYLRPNAPLPERGSSAAALASSWRHNTELSSAAAQQSEIYNIAATSSSSSSSSSRPVARGRGAAAAATSSSSSTRADSESDWRDSTLLLRQSGGGRGWDEEEDRDVANGVGVSEGGMRDALWKADKSLAPPTPSLPPNDSTPIKRRPLVLTATAAEFSFSAPAPVATSPIMRRPLILSATAASFDFSH